MPHINAAAIRTKTTSIAYDRVPFDGADAHFLDWRHVRSNGNRQAFGAIN
jgi:hypothetical protein